MIIAAPYVIYGAISVGCSLITMMTVNRRVRELEEEATKGFAAVTKKVTDLSKAGLGLGIKLAGFEERLKDVGEKVDAVVSHRSDVFDNQVVINDKLNLILIKVGGEATTLEDGVEALRRKREAEGWKPPTDGGYGSSDEETAESGQAAVGPA